MFGHQSKKIKILKSTVLISMSITSIALLDGCAAPSPAQKAISRYESSSLGINNSTITGIRHQALRDSALSTGALAGLAWRSNQINNVVAQHEKLLDRIFNFNAMLLEHNILPPVLIEGRQPLDQDSDNVLRLADRHYYIQTQAKFVTMAPTWRDYLKLPYTDPGIPDQSMLPKNGPERKVWDKYVNEGWQAGICQADTIFNESIGRLKRDYEGMIRYKTLLAQNIVSKPFVAEVNLGVTGNANEMAINDRILSITALPELINNSNDWETLITPLKR